MDRYYSDLAKIKLVDAMQELEAAQNYLTDAYLFQYAKRTGSLSRSIQRIIDDINRVAIMQKANE